jgi:2-(1,2-epoxy-1,2-dihydrophenyl)acetyl-CoA isomerase
LISQVYPPATFTEDSLTFARQLAEGPTRALALTKRCLDLSLFQSLEEQLEVEARMQQEASETIDFKEGLSAFQERRPPRFEGR